MQQRHNIEVVQGDWRREEYANRDECCATDLFNPAQSASGTSAPKPVSATTAAKVSAGSSTFTVLLTMACCFARFCLEAKCRNTVFKVRIGEKKKINKKKT